MLAVTSEFRFVENSGIRWRFCTERNPISMIHRNYKESNLRVTLNLPCVFRLESSPIRRKSCENDARFGKAFASTIHGVESAKDVTDREKREAHFYDGVWNQQNTYPEKKVLVDVMVAT